MLEDNKKYMAFKSIGEIIDKNYGKKKKAESIFDGLHGKIVLICSVCGKRHYPRCKNK